MIKEAKNKKKYEIGVILEILKILFWKNTEGIEAQIDDIRIRLNKPTSNNYESLSEIINYIKKDIETNNDILEYVGKSIFEVGSMNSFWSKYMLDYLMI